MALARFEWALNTRCKFGFLMHTIDMEDPMSDETEMKARGRLVQLSSNRRTATAGFKDGGLVKVTRVSDRDAFVNATIASLKTRMVGGDDLYVAAGGSAAVELVGTGVADVTFVFNDPPGP